MNSKALAKKVSKALTRKIIEQANREFLDLDFDSMSKDNCVACVLDKNQNTLDELKANIANQISNINTPNTTKKTKTW